MTLKPAGVPQQLGDPIQDGRDQRARDRRRQLERHSTGLMDHLGTDRGNDR